MNRILPALLALALAVPAAAGQAFTARRVTRRSGPRGLSLPQGSPGLNFSRGINSRFTAASGAPGTQSSQAGTPGEGTGMLVAGASGVTHGPSSLFTPLGALSAGSGLAGAPGSEKSSTETVRVEATTQVPDRRPNAPEPAGASADCHGADYAPIDCQLPQQPANVPALTADEQRQCEADAAAMPFYLGAQCDPASWWLNHHFFQPGGDWDTRNAACREVVHSMWRTRKTFDSCRANYGSGQRRLPEGGQGAHFVYTFQTQALEKPEYDHLNEFVWAIRTIRQPDRMNVWVSATADGPAVEGAGCSRNGLFTYSSDLDYVLSDGSPLDAAAQKWVDLGEYCVLKPNKTYYLHMEFTTCAASACGVVLELYLH